MANPIISKGNILRFVIPFALLLAALLCTTCQAREIKQQNIVGYGEFQLGMDIESALKLGEFEKIEESEEDTDVIEVYRRVIPEVLQVDDTSFKAIMTIDSVPGILQQVDSIRFEFTELPNQPTAKRLFSVLCLSALEEYDQSLLRSPVRDPNRDSEYSELSFIPSKYKRVATRRTFMFEDKEGDLFAVVFLHQIDGRIVSIRYATRQWYEALFPDEEQQN